jgi:hypothetical protein
MILAAAKFDLIRYRPKVYMPAIPDELTQFTLKTWLSKTGRSLMSRWKVIRYYCKLTWLAFCMRPLPHFQPSPCPEMSS